MIKDLIDRIFSKEEHAFHGRPSDTTPSTKRFYSKYLAGEEIIDLHYRLCDEIVARKPDSILEFGCGTGKILRLLRERLGYGVKLVGIDISPMNILRAYWHEINSLIISDEKILSNLSSFDLLYTCSVLDHIEDIDKIIAEFKRIAKHIVIAETNCVVYDYYYQHDYEALGFTKLDYVYTSKEDTAEYKIYVWQHLF